MKKLGMLLILFCLGCDNHGHNDYSNIESSGSLQTAASEAELETYLKKGLMQQPSNAKTYRYVTLDGTATVTGALFLSDDAGGRSYSGTNLQVVGVDEADRIKTDGQILYLAEQDAGYADSGRSDRSIRVLALNPDAANAAEIARITLADALPLEGLYLLKDHGGAAKDLLVSLGTTQDHYYLCALDWFMPWSWQKRQTEVNLVDVSAPGTPQVVKNYMFDGQLVSSRRIGNQLYLVLRYHPCLTGYTLYPITDLEARKNQTLIEKATLADLLPRYRINGEDQGNIAPYNQSYLPNISSESATADIITLIALDLTAPAERPYAITLAGPTETLYMSTQALYLATTSHHYQPVTRAGALLSYDKSMTTDIHKIALMENGPEYRGSGSVNGHLGWDQDKKSFRIGEVGDAVGVVTSLDERWSGNATSKLTILRESTTTAGTLAEVAHLPNESRSEPLGKPGERLYSARFLGNRLYLVTFRVTDPLYILNLSNPHDPFIEGNLEIKGYSDYLHPVGENLLLGIGKDAVPDLNAPEEGRGAWYQGLKLSLFDVSDAANPSEIKSIVIGERGTDSEVLVDHHAIAYLEREQGSARFVIPVELHETVGSSTNTTEPWYYYDWTHTGLYLFDVSGINSTTPDIGPAGRMIVNSNETGEDDWYSEGDRAVILNDSVYYVHGDSVWSSPWGDADQFVGPQ